MGFSAIPKTPPWGSLYVLPPDKEKGLVGYHRAEETPSEGEIGHAQSSATVCPSTLTIGGPGYPHPPVHVGLCLPQGGGNENCISESLGRYLADEL